MMMMIIMQSVPPPPLLQSTVTPFERIQQKQNSTARIVIIANPKLNSIMYENNLFQGFMNCKSITDIEE